MKPQMQYILRVCLYNVLAALLCPRLVVWFQGAPSKPIMMYDTAQRV